MEEAYKEILESKDKNLSRMKIDIARKYHLNKIPKNIELNLENPKINIKTKPVRKDY